MRGGGRGAGGGGRVCSALGWGHPQQRVTAHCSPLSTSLHTQYPSNTHTPSTAPPPITTPPSRTAPEEHDVGGADVHLHEAHAVQLRQRARDVMQQDLLLLRRRPRLGQHFAQREVAALGDDVGRQVLAALLRRRGAGVAGAGRISGRPRLSASRQRRVMLAGTPHHTHITHQNHQTRLRHFLEARKQRDEGKGQRAAAVHQ